MADGASNLNPAPIARSPGRGLENTRWPHVNFTGHIGYTNGKQLLRRSPQSRCCPSHPPKPVA